MNTGSDAALAWLAAAVSGQRIEVRSSLKVELSWSDGRVIHLSAGLSAVERQHAVVAQALLCSMGSLEPSITRRLALRPRLASRYMALELFRAGALFAGRLPPRFAALLPAPSVFTGGSAEASLQQAQDAKGSAAASLPPFLGTVRPLFAAHGLASLLAGRGSPTRGAKNENADEPDTRALDGADQKLLERFRTPLSSGFGFADFLLRLMDYRRSAGDVVTDSAQGPAALAHAASVQTGRGGNSYRTAGRVRKPPLPPRRTKGLSYPEWDVQAGRYLMGHVHVSEIVPLLDTSESAFALAALPAIAGLKRSLARVGTSRQRVRRQAKGDELDVDALADLLVQRRAGYSEHENIYVDSRPIRRDLTALVLLDISRSTADLGSDGTTVLQRHAAVGQQISTALAALGDRSAFYGFHSWGRELVRFVRLKGFDEEASAAIPRVAALSASGLTRTGAALRHATQLLRRDQHHQRRLLLLFTDGFPYDDGYEGRYAFADTERALQEAAMAGVACVCVHVGTDQEDAALRYLYGDAAFLKCEQAVGLAQPLGRLMQSALHVADRAPRRFDPLP